MGKKWLSLLMTLVVLVAGCSTPVKPTPTQLPEGVTPLDPPIILSEVSMADQNNAAWKLSDWKGKYALFTFGYTHCPDVCPINLANFKQVKNNLGADAQLNYVFVSVDGERDTPDVLKKHLAIYDSIFLGLTGDATQTAAIAKTFNVVYKLEKTTPDQKEYNVTHSASSFLMDKKGQLVRIYSYGTSPVTIADDIKKMMQG